MADPVLVVGAGPTGLTAAVELARRGCPVTVIERRPGPSHLSRAVGITQASMDLLAPSGVAHAIAAEAIAFSALHLHDERGARILTLPMDFDDRSRLWGLAQDRTEAHLAAALARLGVEVAYDTALDGVDQDADGVTARYGGASHRHPYLIAADGVRSTVRAALGIPYEGYDLPNPWSIADVEAADWPHPTAFGVYLLRGGNVCVVVPLEAARYRLVASVADALAALPVPMTVRTVRRSGAFPISVRRAARFRVGRVLLAGDAGHCHSPAGGRGMNLGIADAADAARRLTDGTLEGYDAARRAAADHVIAFSERGRRTLLARNPLRRAAVRTAIHILDAIPPLGRAAIRQFTSG